MSISCLPRKVESQGLSRCPTHLLELASAPKTIVGQRELLALGRHYLRSRQVAAPAVQATFEGGQSFPGAEYLDCSLYSSNFLVPPPESPSNAERAHLLRCGSEPEVTRRPPRSPIEKTGGRAKAREPPACPCPADISADWSFWFILPISSCRIHPSLGIEPEPAPDFYRLTFLLTARRRFALCEEARLVDIPADIISLPTQRRRSAQEIRDILAGCS